MVFSSLNFIFIFLPLFLFAYYVTPAAFRNSTLFAGEHPVLCSRSDQTAICTVSVNGSDLSQLCVRNLPLSDTQSKKKRLF